jgi:Ran GTPase-activating protein (RanGAP) involved in mRNA processing and transport
MQVLGVADIEALLGKRPFVSEEMRNIDRYRHGFEKVEDGEAEEGKGDAKANDEGDEDEAGQQRFFDPNIIVAT